ncbi:GTP-binding domain protein [Onchocerca flexuosa]|uniref:GTP-binding domain protein n=2 Tax=Onchocerca flexuosa TaxID=387005 RepID=A0A238BP38_9BILA|nr:GTP-binding domain protein [Onchocerca flexuosa]
MGLLSQISIALGVSRKQVNVLMIGLDNSGKSTIINEMKAKDDQVTQVLPSVGCATEKFIFNNTTFLVHDMSGKGKYRNLWENYYKEVDGVVFVVDSSDRLRLVVAQDELQLMLENKEFARRKVRIILKFKLKFKFSRFYTYPDDYIVLWIRSRYRFLYLPIKWMKMMQ